MAHRDTALYSLARDRLQALRLTGSVAVSPWACIWMPGSCGTDSCEKCDLDKVTLLTPARLRQHQPPDFQPGPVPEFPQSSSLWEDKQEEDC